MLTLRAALRMHMPIFLQLGRQKYGDCGSPVVGRISDTLAVKKCRRNLAEAATLRFIREHTNIPVPVVHDAWKTPDGTAYILMEWIGNPDVHRLQDCWDSLTTSQKEKIASQLREYLDQLRSLPQPSHMRGWIGPPDGSAIFDPRLHTDTCGPFASESAFNDFLLARMRESTWHAAAASKRIEEVRSRLRHDHHIVFTHGDINSRNILIDLDGNVAGLVDWEMSGWMPEYWEYLKCNFAQGHDPEWLAFFPTFVEPYQAELDNANECVDIIMYGGARTP